ncbi:MAG TPA: arginine--tRNA ligase, partial [Bacteroidales bacterium]|nr:arginine--tRNA ligase [Bacteroidales bacterium]
ESQTYLSGKSIVLEGLDKQSFYRKDDNSIWCDLQQDGLDEKLLLRSDGTSVYITQDLGTAEERHDHYKADQMIYVVGNEQNYHFDVLKLILKKLGRQWADGIEHLSYGMVELPEGKMKSREGTVVDADDLVDEMVHTARQMTEELGKASNLSEIEADKLYKQIGLGALKYYILKVDPKKTMMFNPAESIDFNGNTGPFIQYTHARIRSVLQKAVDAGYLQGEIEVFANTGKEKHIVKILHQFPAVVSQAGEQRSPALIANYMYDLAKEYNQFYQACPIIREENESLKKFRIGLSLFVANVLKMSGRLLGMEMPDRM